MKKDLPLTIDVAIGAFVTFKKLVAGSLAKLLATVFKLNFGNMCADETGKIERCFLKVSGVL